MEQLSDRYEEERRGTCCHARSSQVSQERVEGLVRGWGQLSDQYEERQGSCCHAGGSKVSQERVEDGVKEGGGKEWGTALWSVWGGDTSGTCCHAGGSQVRQGRGREREQLSNWYEEKRRGTCCHAGGSQVSQGRVEDGVKEGGATLWSVWGEEMRPMLPCNNLSSKSRYRQLLYFFHLVSS